MTLEVLVFVGVISMAFQDRKKQSMDKRQKLPFVELHENRASVAVYHEARAFGMAALSHCEQGMTDFEMGPIPRYGEARYSAWARQQGFYMSVLLDHKNGFSGQIVVGEISEEETAEWIGRMNGRLDLPCGQLVIPGQIIRVPRGKYEVEVLAYFPGETAFRCADNHWHKPSWEPDKQPHEFLGREALGSYFRRTRPEREFPGWLMAVCLEDPREDPGHEQVWQDVRGDDIDQALNTLGVSCTTCIDLVIHLTPVEQFSPRPLEAQNMWPWHTRQPLECPLGVPPLHLHGDQD